MDFKNILNKYSENIAGYISLFGSLILIFMGDIKSIVAAIMFTIAELSLAKYGNKIEGYTSAAFLFMIGNIFLIFSPSLDKSFWVQFSLWGMTSAWTIGALRYFLRKSNFKYTNEMPSIAGALNIVFKFPGILSAIFYGHYIVAFAIFCWMIADILAGRLQEKVFFIRGKLNLFIHK